MKARAVDAYDFAVVFNNAPADHDGINVTALCRMYHRAEGIPGLVEVNVASINQDEVSLFAGRQAANFVLKTCAESAIDGRRFKKQRCLCMPITRWR
jgi:hypothetical protein